MKGNNNKKSKEIKASLPVPAPVKVFPPLITAIFSFCFFIWAYYALKCYFKSINFQPLDSTAFNIIFSTLYNNSCIGAQGVSFLFGHFYHIFILFFILLGAYGLGSKIWITAKFISPEESAGDEAVIFQVALGIAGVIFFTLIIGLCGFLYYFVILSFMATFALIGLFEIMNLIKMRKNAIKNKNKLQLMPVIAIVLAFAINLMGALVPETFYDSLVYNMGIPQNWINFHKIFSTKCVLASYFPLNMSVFYIAGIMLKDGIITKLMSFAFIGGMSFGVYIFCKKYLTSQIGLVAAMIFCTVPIVMSASWKTVVEAGLGYFEFLALFCFVNWWNEDKNKWLYLSAVFAGISLGGKYTSFFTTVSLFALIFVNIVLIKRKNIINWLKYSAIFSLIALLVCSVWYIKNLIITGDPLFPVLTMYKMVAKSSDTQRISYSFKNIVLFPWNYTMGNIQQETFLGPLFLITFPLLFLIKKIDKNIKILFVYSSVYIILWIVVARAYNRFLIPALPAISIIGAYYIVNCPWNAMGKKITSALVVFIALTNIYFAAYLQKSIMDPLGYILGLQSDSDYLSTSRPTYPTPFYRTIEWANKSLDKNTKILILGDSRGFYLERRFLWNTVDSASPLISYCLPSDTMKSADDLYNVFKNDGITHFLLNVPEAERLKGYNMFNWTGQDLVIFSKFWDKYVREINHSCADVTLGLDRVGSSVPQFWDRYSHNPVNYSYLYEIMTPQEAGKPHTAPHNFFLDKVMYTDAQWKNIEQFIRN